MSMQKFWDDTAKDGTWAGYYDSSADVDFLTICVALTEKSISLSLQLMDYGSSLRWALRATRIG